MTYRENPNPQPIICSVCSRAPRVGVLVRAWRYLFGEPAFELPKIEELQCGSRDFDNERCSGMPDSRCAGGNCSKHCRDHCYGKCIDVWQIQQQKKRTTT